jgi:hypothetical protein
MNFPWLFPTENSRELSGVLPMSRHITSAPTVQYEEHMQAIRNNNSNSRYSNHILNTGHIWNHNRYHGHHKNTQKRKTFIKQIGKIPHIQNQQRYT